MTTDWFRISTADRGWLVYSLFIVSFRKVGFDENPCARRPLCQARWAPGRGYRSQAAASLIARARAAMDSITAASASATASSANSTAS